MTLEKLLREASLTNPRAGKGVEIAGITDDSRKVRPGYLFVAVKGLEHDGHSYVEQAISQGAVAVVFDVNSKFHPPAGGPNSKPKRIAFIGANNSRRALGLLWCAWSGWPSKKIKVIGVTGTDGKTTTVNLIYHLLKSAGRKAGMISTINACIGEKEIDTGFHVTSPQPELLQKLLSEMVEAHLEYVVLEVTSHGLDQERLVGLEFEGAVMTNVTHEHLDYHGTFENYLRTKGRLFKKSKFSVLNRDDESFGYLSKLAVGSQISYGLAPEAELRPVEIEPSETGTRFKMALKDQTTITLYSTIVNLPLPGIYNVSNALAAATVCLKLGLTLEEIAANLSTFKGLAGRFEEIKLGQPFRVIVDFAHTPNALEQVLKLSEKFKVKSGKLIVVFGCAGERDKEKRPVMGEISGRLANVSVLTAEDPRREDLDDIINNIAEGCLKAGAVEVQSSKFKVQSFNNHLFVRIPDRRQAIKFALENAQPSDLVLITGKGHEKSMCFGVTEYPWSDREVIGEELKKVNPTQ